MNTPPLPEATKLAEEIALLCPDIDLIFLDQWRRSREKDEWRLTYLGERIEACANTCPSCPIYTTVGGEDNSAENKRLITTLVQATETDLQNYAGSQHYLNCKSLDQYITSFARCFQRECHTREEMSNEFEYVVSFKVVYHFGQENLEIIEEQIKHRIVQESLNSLDQSRKVLFLDAAKEKGLIK